jgi:hypothetical protein
MDCYEIALHTPWYLSRFDTAEPYAEVSTAFSLVVGSVVCWGRIEGCHTQQRRQLRVGWIMRVSVLVTFSLEVQHTIRFSSLHDAPF